MIIRLNVPERIAIYAALSVRNPGAGGDAQADLWEALKLEDAGKLLTNGLDLAKLSPDQAVYKVSPQEFRLVLFALLHPLPFALHRVAVKAFDRVRKL